MSTDAVAYIRTQFEPGDRLAVVLVNRPAGRVMQRIATAEKIASPGFQAQLRQHNHRGYEVYLSMNTLRAGAYGRTKADIAAVRHVFLDLDENGDQALREIRLRTDLPVPNVVMSTSPGKWQVIWKVEDFTKESAESLQKTLAHDIDADPAATDCARVLRLPGFYNHKYGRAHLVRADTLSGRVYRPEHFPHIAERHEDRGASYALHLPGPTRARAGRSQSERDWAYAKRALARGEPEHLVIAAIASYRRYDKHDPQYYAELTVRKAAASRTVPQSPLARSEVPPGR